MSDEERQNMSHEERQNILQQIEQLAAKLGGDTLLPPLNHPRLPDEQYAFNVHTGMAEAVVYVLGHQPLMLPGWVGYAVISMDLDAEDNAFKEVQEAFEDVLQSQLDGPYTVVDDAGVVVESKFPLDGEPGG